MIASRLALIAVGAAAGAYGSVKARRAAYRLSGPGLVDQAAALGLGWRELREEIADGMATHEQTQYRKLTSKGPQR